MYTLRFPFRIPQEDQSLGKDIASINIGELLYSLENLDPYFVLTIKGFLTEAEAERHINRIWAGFMWLLLNRGISVNAILATKEVFYTDDPIKAAENVSKTYRIPIRGPLHGSLDGTRPAVFPSNKKLSILTGYAPIGIAITPPSTMLTCIAEGLSFPHSDELINDNFLRLALELYRAYFTEASRNARFLTLIMALEVLRPQPSKRGSIRKQIYEMVLSTLQQVRDEEAELLAEKAQYFYCLRNELVHEGILNSSVAVDEARQLVQRVLKAKYLAYVQ
ncbi:MAG TPA: HEPN domain-containing protein [Syntrophales bacterium]|mgnify:CR=1 FL=1|nr:HEPN domain-containing protein [Syntrophales bacterium]